MSARRFWATVLRTSYFVLLLLLVACGQPAASDSGMVAWPGPFTVPTPLPTQSAPPPITFPRDEAPHNDLTEWWYFTGHLKAADGTAYGFESVIFQSERGDFAPLYAAHLAITDHARGAFHYDQRTQQGGAMQSSGPGFDLKIGDWSWRGLNGQDHIAGQIPDYALTLDLTATKPPALHKGGYIDYGPAGGTYYYSRTRMTISGTLIDHGATKQVTGEAWFDHQWGNFLTVSTGGWNWFSAQLNDGSDFMVYLLRGENEQIVGSLGTYVYPDGHAENIDVADIQVDVLDHWTSPHTGITYPSGWRITLPKYGLVLTCTPVLPDQELDTRRSTANIYWEGETRYAGTQNGTPIAGAGYVELTGYDQGR